jgi:hypothetical protein
MGADFTYAIMPVCELTEARLNMAKERIENTDFQEVHEEYGGWEPQEFKDQALKLLELYPVLCDGRRDTAQLCLDSRGPRYVITGGLSWGESPTDAYDHMEIKRSTRNMAGGNPRNSKTRRSNFSSFTPFFVWNMWTLFEQWANEDAVEAQLPQVCAVQAS